MNDDWRWLIGIDVGVATSYCIALFTMYRVLSSTMRAADDALHSRINQVRDEYVRRIEFDTHFNLLRDDVRELREDLKETNKRLDQLMSVLAREKG